MLFSTSSLIPESFYGKSLFQAPNEWKEMWEDHDSRQWKNLAFLKEPAIIIGTGSTTSLALLIARLGLYFWNKAWIPLFPYEYLELPSPPSSLLCISYSGKTKDIEYALSHGKQKEVSQIFLVTGNPHTSFKRYLSSSGLFSFSTKRVDNGFAPSFSTLILASLFLTYLGQKESTQPLCFSIAWE
ncbi:MAG: hypothetical protein D6785_00825, partial [Planctomycetota bacterium]